MLPSFVPPSFTHPSITPEVALTHKTAKCGGFECVIARIVVLEAWKLHGRRVSKYLVCLTRATPLTLPPPLLSPPSVRMP